MFALCYGLYSCSPHWYDHLYFREAQGTFTTELAHVRSPSHESVITTWVNRQLPGRDFHPLETQPYGLHTPAVTGAFEVSVANEKCVRVYGLVKRFSFYKYVYFLSLA